ncbi:MAG: biotin-dependent carboxyltransferase family protein [Deltaproteobacteria bacterium]|nr:biotin-dependent carboxyltransferase family protein [Deltaproteobacteria bacterium]
MPTIEIIAAGALTTVQDQGRAGLGRFGISPSGALDPFSLRVGNACVGNPKGAAGLEITGPGVALRFYGSTWICLTGADLQATLQDEAVRVGDVVRVRDRQVLRFTSGRAGSRAWLTARGGLRSDKVLGSRAFDVAAGLPRQRLAAGDMLEIEPEPGASVHQRVPPDLVPYVLRPAPTGPRSLRYVALGATGLAERTFTVSQRANRTGFQIMADPPMPNLWPQPPRSEPLAPGCIQVPPDGHPFVLMADRQTIGGYPVAGHLCSVDVGEAAQCGPGDKVQLTAILLDVARDLAQARERTFRRTF